MPMRSVTVSTASTPVLSFNNRRTTASLTNNGSATIFINSSQANITTNGYPITVGGSIDFIRALGDEPQLAMYAAVATGTENLRIIEQYGAVPESLYPEPFLPITLEA